MLLLLTRGTKTTASELVLRSTSFVKDMCLIVFAWDVHPKYQLILTANRDEFYERPTALAEPWFDQPEIIGGRDLQAGGTWMGIHKSGKFAALTNYRDPSNIRGDARSRGDIPTNFLKGNQTPEKYLKELDQSAHEYNGFNALIGNRMELLHYSNCEGKINRLKPGIYALSNALLDTPWPKVELAKARFEEAIAQDFMHDDLLEVMNETSLAPDDQLPNTGVGYSREKALSAMCIRMEGYGTCCSTAITIEKSGAVDFTEKTFAVGSRKPSMRSFNFTV